MMSSSRLESSSTTDELSFYRAGGRPKVVEFVYDGRTILPRAGEFFIRQEYILEYK